MISFHFEQDHKSYIPKHYSNPVVFTFAKIERIEILKESMESNVKSPCIKVCKYDSEKNCMGCHRSMDEITNWIIYDDDQKRQALTNAEVRKKTPITGINNYDYYV